MEIPMLAIPEARAEDMFTRKPKENERRTVER